MNKQQRFYQEMQKGLKKLNVSENNTNLTSIYPQSLETKYGVLLVHVDGDQKDCAKSKVYTCYTRFEDVDRAKEHVGCNPFTGKWNFHEHVKGNIPEQIAQSFIRRIKYVINT